MHPEESTAHLPEAAARRVLLLREVESVGGGEALWSLDDAAWATRLARETASASAGAADWLALRAGHAWQRLAPRDRALAELAGHGLWRPRALLGALSVGLVLGLVADSVGGVGVVDLLAPPLAAVLAWNLAVYAWLGVAALSSPGPGRWMRSLVRRWMAPAAAALPAARRFAADWAVRTQPLWMARAALLLHLAAAALAAGLIGGMYLRGLVFDFRASWQSTFLDEHAVHALLATLLAPASALTGIAVPDAAVIATLRTSGAASAPLPASAAPWIHLFAATLALVVVLPRLALAALAALAGWHHARRVPLALAEPYFQRLLQPWRRTRARIVVLPHGGAPSPQATLALQRLVVQAFGDDGELAVQRATAYGDEEGVPAAAAGTTWRLALFDLASTPEPEAQGRFVDALRAPGAPPLLLLVDEAAARQRWATLPERLAERRAAWQRFADEAGVALALVDLAAAMPDAAPLEAALQQAR